MNKPSGHYVITSTVAEESVRAFVPNALPPELPGTALVALQEPLQAAQAALDKLNLAGQMLPSLDWFIYSFVRKEALLSSEIEGTQATLVDVFSFEHTEQAGSSSVDDIEEITNYVAAMHYALDELHSNRGLPLSLRLLNGCHLRLMQGRRGADKQPGEIRRSQNWIGGSRPGNAAFVPPPPEQVTDLLGGLERYIHSGDALPALLRIAAIHLQFETIHPYLDGNGRVGRMLIALLLDHWQLLSSPLLYISGYLKERQSDYYQHLESVRRLGDWGGWFEFFLAGIVGVATEAEDRARQLHRRVNGDRQMLLALDTVTVPAIRLFEQLPDHPVITAPLVTRLLKTSKPTAGKTIKILRNAGIISEVGERKRDRRYSYVPYIDLLK